MKGRTRPRELTDQEIDDLIAIAQQELIDSQMERIQREAIQHQTNPWYRKRDLN